MGSILAFLFLTLALGLKFTLWLFRQNYWVADFLSSVGRASFLLPSKKIILFAKGCKQRTFFHHAQISKLGFCPRSLNEIYLFWTRECVLVHAALANTATGTNFGLLACAGRIQGAEKFDKISNASFLFSSED